jgi:signal transduction histidine kinase
MSALLDGLLAQAAADAREPLAPVELEQAASEAIENLHEALTASGTAVHVSSLPVVLGDATGMVRLFQNLLSNAVKYRSQAAPVIHITSEWLGAEWVIRISDNGIGIPEEHHRRVFEPFVRLLPHKAPGVGIGLSNCQRIVKQMGGVIWVESEPGVGSEFCFTALCSRRAASSRIEAGPPR